MSNEIEKIEIDKSQLAELLERNQQLQNENNSKDEDIRQLYDACMNIMEMVGVAKDGRVKKEITEPGGNAISEVLKEAGSIITLVMKAQVPVVGKKYEEKLADKFAFFKDLMPLFQKYELKYGKTFTINVSNNSDSAKQPVFLSNKPKGLLGNE